MKTVTLDEFQDLIKSQGRERIEDVTFRCPVCGTLQSAQDLIDAGAGSNMREVEKYVGFSCVGRFTGAGAHVKDEPPGRGCNWTLGGLFRAHELEVVTPDGKHHPMFEPATAEE